MTEVSRRVPYVPEPNAAEYHAAHAYAVVKEAKIPAKFASWYIDNCADKLSVADAWERYMGES
ncbi:hypothetical protein [Mycobacteroides chelonae]|uniref:hypothetical protein n=1 Tax=Mycobacteroides chelonae TaxID=1774 RepID=UPI0009947ECD|nr:hypothetical protein [Mycobacteroides chelonae]